MPQIARGVNRESDVVEEKWKVFLKVRGKGNKLNVIKTAYRIPVSDRGTSSKRK